MQDPNYYKCRTGFDSDTVNFNTQDGWLFPYYVEDGKVYLVLWTQYWSPISGDGHWRGYRNGLGGSFPVNVTVELISGNQVENMFTKTFRSWRTVQ